MKIEKEENVFGRRLKKELERSELNQATVAAMLNLTPATISNYVTGRRQPEFETVLKLAQILNCSVDYLLGKTDVRDLYLPNIQYEDAEMQEIINEIVEAANKAEKIGEITPDAKRQLIFDTKEYFFFRLFQEKKKQE